MVALRAEFVCVLLARALRRVGDHRDATHVDERASSRCLGAGHYRERSDRVSSSKRERLHIEAISQLKGDLDSFDWEYSKRYSIIH